MLDQVANFIKELVNGAHDDSTTTINVVDASAFPDPASGNYNLTWFDITNYPDPSDDPNVEIVRVTASDTGLDTLTVTRAQEGTSASTKNTGGATYALVLAPTKKTIGDLDVYNADAKTTPVDDDLLGILDSAASYVLKKLTWANLKATLKTYFDTLYTKCTGAEIDTGTNDVKFATPKAIADSKIMKSPASSVTNHVPLFDGTTGKLLKSAGYGIRFATAVVTTNISGDASIAFSSAFATSTTVVIPSNGDYTTGNLLVAINGTPTAAGFNIRVTVADTGAVYVGNFRCNYVAFGV